VKRWFKILVVLVVLVAIALMSADILWWFPFHELSKGQLAIVGDSGTGVGIYLLDLSHGSWRQLPTGDLLPWDFAWSPDGKKIAFTYSTVGGYDSDYVVGVAILNLENMETAKVYVSPSSNETLNAVTWSLDGQSLIFDVYGNNDLIAFQRLDIQTGELQRIPFPQNIRPQYFGINHIEVAQNNDYVIGGPDGVYVVPPNLGSLYPITPYEEGFFLTPDRKEITTPCAQSLFCNYNIDTGKLTQIYRGGPPIAGNWSYGGADDLVAGNWSYDGKNVVYLLRGGGIDDPEYVVLADMMIKQNYEVYKTQPRYEVYKPQGRIEGSVSLLRLAWHSVK